MTPELNARRDAAQATLLRFDGAAFRWSTNDCTRLAAFHARKMGHKPNMPKSGSYSSLLGAAKALKAAGFDSLTAAVDAMFVQIPPATALVGDLVALPGEGGWPALCVYLGNGRVLGFKDGRGGVLQPHHFVTAWRVPCLKR